MKDNPDGIERNALDMVNRFGDTAVYLARDLAERAEGRRDESAKVWHAIADAIDRINLKL